MTTTSYQRWAQHQCMCHGTGFVEVCNDGQFRGCHGHPLPKDKAATVQVVCKCQLGQRINDKNPKRKRAVFDPAMMRTVGSEQGLLFQ